MERFEDVESARAWCAAERAAGKSLGLVPTMGALHEGHLELVRRSLAENDRTVVSVFVNPLQFNDPRDLERYPRDFDGDAALLAAVGCSMVFTGTPAEFFGETHEGHFAMPLLDPGPCALGLEGVKRPGHFAGVATVVHRLFEVAQPTRAYFGRKDFQQCLVVAALVEGASEPRIVTCPTVREPSGLARSSRNLLLGEVERTIAPTIGRALRAAREAWRAGERDASALAAVLRGVLASEPALDVEYAELRDPDAWTEHEPKGRLERAVALIAAGLGGVRLIDNLRLDDPSDPTPGEPLPGDA